MDCGLKPNLLVGDKMFIKRFRFLFTAMSLQHESYSV